MRVRVFFHGILSCWMGTEEAFLEIPKEASLRDLSQAVRFKFKERMPSQLWDQKKGFFPSHILLTRGGQPLGDPNSPLHPEDEIHMFLLVPGG